MVVGRLRRTDHSTFNARFTSVALAAGFIALAGCGRDSVLEPDPSSSAIQTHGNGDTSTTSPPVTSNGPVATVVVSPKQVSIPQGYYTYLLARPLDAKGVLVAGKFAQWRSSDANIAVTSDTGLVYGKNVGTAKIFATIDGHTDSATVTVTTPVPPRPPTDTLPSPVSAFTLNVVTLGSLARPDTTATEPVAGTTLKLTRVGAVNGDTLNPSVLVGTAVTNTRGEATFTDVPAGYYTILATPPAGSPYHATSAGFGPPRTTEVNVRMVMQR